MLDTLRIDWLPAEGHRLFRVGQGQGDDWYAVRTVTPIFAVSASSRLAVERMAGEAIGYFLTLNIQGASK